MTIQELDLQLSRQLDFLRNSAAKYDEGCTHEAVRIAVVIRVLCHDTGSSTSLLQHMGRKETIELSTTAKQPTEGEIEKIDFVELMAGMTFGGDLSYDPVPEGTPTIPCPNWWEQQVFICDGRAYTRKEIVLATANKDGGAHVDEPSVGLNALREGFWVRTVTHSDGTETSEPLENTHFRMLRRFADELLSSQDLLSLVPSSPE